MAKRDFSGQVFVITGAASGIGRALALQTAGSGAVVHAADWNEDGLAETMQLAQASGFPIVQHRLDVSDAAAIEAFAEPLIPTLEGRKLVLINNAGVALHSGPFADTSLDDFEWLLQINLWGAIRLTKAFYPYWLQTNKGHIVNISSVFGLIGVAENAAYCTAKFALRGFTETIRMELRGTGIRATTVHPGGIRTNIVRNARLANSAKEKEHARSVQSFERQAMTSAESAAAQILNAVARGRERLVIGADGKAIDLMARLLPLGYTPIVEARLRKTFGVD